MNSPRLPGTLAGEEITALSLLTRRERQVARLISLGHTNIEMGNLLHIHQKTVETHRNHLMTKLGLRTRADLVRFALAQGLLASGPKGRFFRACSGCTELWAVRSQFLSDHEVSYQGVEPGDAPNTPPAFIFLHRRCGARLSVDLESFIDLAGEPLLAAPSAQTGKAAEYCLAKVKEQPCSSRCSCAFVWRASQILSRWPRNRAAE
ncbi:MAG TPA: helix-turn-helix transcriptional regulator [Verrucomicrobiae bacterium]